MISKSILKTLLYFDLRNHPLTLEEVFSYLARESPDQAIPSIEELKQALVGLVAQGKIESDGKYYYLRGHSQLVTQRSANASLNQRRLKRAKRFVKLVRFQPFIRGVILTGSLSAGYSNEQSDVDFWVITKKNRLWLARILLTGLTQVLGVRRYGSKMVNRICLNHYLAEEELPQILYRPNDYPGMKVLLNPAAAEYFYFKQEWLKDYLLNPPQKLNTEYSVAKSSFIQPAVELILEILGARFWNKLAAKYQRKRIVEGPGIFVADTELAFHPGNKREELAAEFEAKLNKLESF